MTEIQVLRLVTECYITYSYIVLFYDRDIGIETFLDIITLPFLYLVLFYDRDTGIETR